MRFLITIAATLALAPAASAQTLSIPTARVAIARYIGPGTVTTKCRQFSPQVVGCRYQTPAINVGIITEGAGVYRGFATDDVHGVHQWVMLNV